jgi:hypothetical protein
MSDRQVLRGLADVAIASPLFAFAPVYRRWHLRWGATDAEVAGAMPGDELVAEPSFNATRAITIDAPPEAVWPWLVQIGYGRAGFYSYDLFDNAARPSAERILPEYQEPKVGDWVPMASKVNETTAFKVKAFEQSRWLLWEKPHSTWAWKLVSLEHGRTRLIAVSSWGCESSRSTPTSRHDIPQHPCHTQHQQRQQQRCCSRKTPSAVRTSEHRFSERSAHLLGDDRRVRCHLSSYRRS